MKTKIPIILLILVVLIAGSYYFYNNSAESYIPSNDEILNNNRTALPTATNFTVEDINGKEINLSDFKGKAVVVNFWASWCPPCKMEMPYFNKLYLENKDDIVFLMIDLISGRETVESGRKYIADNSFSFPVYFDTKGNAASAYKISSIPLTLFINKEGEIVRSYNYAINEFILKDCINVIK